MKNNYIMNQKIISKTNLFGKEYFWMQDPEGTVYLLPAKPHYGVSVDDGGEASLFLEGMVPDFDRL